MQAMVKSHQSGSDDVFKSIAAHFSELSNKQQKVLNEVGKNFHRDKNSDHMAPEWIYSPPTDLSQSRYFNGCHWYFVPSVDAMVIGCVYIVMTLTYLPEIVKITNKDT
jgi:hypothetical protein